MGIVQAACVTGGLSRAEANGVGSPRPKARDWSRVLDGLRERTLYKSEYPSSGLQSGRLGDS